MDFLRIFLCGVGSVVCVAALVNAGNNDSEAVVTCCTRWVLQESNTLKYSIEEKIVGGCKLKRVEKPIDVDMFIGYLIGSSLEPFICDSRLCGYIDGLNRLAKVALNGKTLLDFVESNGSLRVKKLGKTILLCEVVEYLNSVHGFSDQTVVSIAKGQLAKDVVAKMMFDDKRVELEGFYDKYSGELSIDTY